MFAFGRDGIVHARRLNVIETRAATDPSHVGTRAARKSFAALAAVGAMGLICFENGHRIPVLTYVNLGIHELGHMLTYAFSDIANALAGSVAQVGVPLALAVYFFIARSDWIAAGLCLAWAATSSLEVALYVADAPTKELELIGGSHDWAFILGPDGYGALDRAAPLADSIRSGAWIALISGGALCLASAFRTRPQADAAASASRATAVSSPWAASATSGSAARSASSPK